MWGREYNERGHHRDGDLFREYTPRLARAIEPKPDIRAHILNFEILMTPNETMAARKAKSNHQLFSLATNDKKALLPLGGFSDINHTPARDPSTSS